MTDERTEFEAARAAGLKARHETRVERAIRRQVAEEIAAEIDHFQKALEDAYAKRGNIADDLRADAAEYCATIARSIGIQEAS